MSNEVLNKSSEGGLSLNVYKIRYNGVIYYHKEIVDCNDNMIDGFMYDGDGKPVTEPDLFENVIDVINKM